MMKPENTTRKIDALGRITLPKGLRDRMFLNTDDELELFTTTHDGKEYICLTKSNGVDPKYLAAKSVLEELGSRIPVELEAACKGEKNGSSN